MSASYFGKAMSNDTNHIIYNDHWDDVKRRMLGYWSRESMDRCCAAIRVSKPGYTDFGEKNFYFDTELADRMHRKRFENTWYFGEALPCLFPYFGTAGIAEYTGCKPNRTPRTTWFEPWLDEPDASGISYSHPEAFEAQKRAIADLLKRSKGEYLVSVSDNAGILDALAAIRGTNELLVDMLSDPEFVEEGVQALLPIYKQTEEELFDLVRENNDGCVLSWMDLWAPSRMAQMQCDLSVMISPEMYKRFTMPELEELCEFLDYPVYHFDGQEQIRHLDMLLSLKKLRAIQWTPVAGQPKTSTFIEPLKRIQKAGKNLILTPRLEEIEFLLSELSSRGLILLIYGLSSPREAEDMLTFLQKHSKDRG